MVRSKSRAADGGMVALAFTLLWLALPPLLAQVVLTGDTAEPRHSLFLADQEIVLNFRVHGLPRETDEVLEVRVSDIASQVVYERRVPLTVGRGEFATIGFKTGGGAEPSEWLIALPIPYQRLGYYQAHARLSGGATLPSVGSRPGGYLTYAIILDPSQRRSFPARETFFGMIGAFESALIGANWYVHNYNTFTWKSFEPDNPEQFFERVAQFEAEEQRGGWAAMPHFEGRHYYNLAGRSGHLPQYSILYFGTPPYWAADNTTRTHLTATLTRDGEEQFRQFCLKLGRYMAEKRANEALHYYQVTDEPDIPWGYKGSIESLVRLYEIAYPALHSVDPQAVVAGPGINLGAHKQLEEMLRCGFGRYVDVLDFHPYMGGDVLPEEFGLIDKIQTVKELVRRYVGRELPMTGTESGHNAQGDTMDIWLRKAWADVQHNLILLGEGFWLNVAFHGGDQSRKTNENTWGYFFNLDIERDYGIQKASPKPVVPAYATLSWLLEGHKSIGSLAWLGQGVVGYAYSRDGAVTLALWSRTPVEVKVPTGTERVQLYDWMGNVDERESPNGSLTLTTRRDPQYIRGVAAAHCGTSARSTCCAK